MRRERCVLTRERERERAGRTFARPIGLALSESNANADCLDVLISSSDILMYPSGSLDRDQCSVTIFFFFSLSLASTYVGFHLGHLLRSM